MPAAMPLGLRTEERIIPADLNRRGLRTGAQHLRELQAELTAVLDVKSGG